MLEIKNLHAGYGRLKILRGINLSVPKGGIIALLGGNGTGKSTLLKTISGLLPVMEGSIEFDGEILERIKPHEIVKSGLVQVTQSKESYPAMTVEENLMVGSYVRSDRNAIKQDLEKIYQFFPILKKRRKTLSGTLSGGEVQMLVIGRGLMANPKMLMLDEPSAAIAPKIVLEIFSNIYKISQTGVTILIVEQNVRMALLLAQYGYIIRDGVIMLEGKSEDLIHDPSVRESFLGGTVSDATRELSA
ncbi:MAG: ABC transporter ATP-binding protein [SAR324 cluster bacterium]|nr:ABC transporter ATP-binding protein [SAR324 cluster bacterium]